MWRDRFNDWAATFAAAAVVAAITLMTVAFVAPYVNDIDLRRALYTGAIPFSLPDCSAEC